MGGVFSHIEALALENSWRDWLAAFIAGGALFMVGTLLRSFANRQYLLRSKTDAVELLEVPLLIASRTTLLFLLLLSVFLGLQFLEVPPRAMVVVHKTMVIICFWQAGIYLATGALAGIEFKRRESLKNDRAAAGTLSIVSVIVKVTIWVAVLLLALDNLGVKITTLIAGLGIGGVAIALAVQNVLGDLLASLSITFDKPFVVGDALGVDDINGTVEQIGVKTTRLRSITGEQIIMANADLLKSRVHNYGRMGDRRVVFTIGVTYETAHDKLKQIPAQLRRIVESHEDVRFDRGHFARYGAYAIEFEVVFFVTSTDYNRYMDLQQDINLEVHKYFQEQQIEFAQTTPRLTVTAVPAKAS